MARAVVLEPRVAEFDRRAREGNLVPVSCEVLADLDTPISAFMRLRHLPHAVPARKRGGQREDRALLVSRRRTRR